MRVVVTGGSGFLGALVTRLLAGEGHEVVVADLAAPAAGVRFIRCDVSDERAVEQLASPGADAIVHLAGLLGTAETFASPQRTFRVNTIGSANVLEACHASGARYFGVETGAPWPNPYAISKRAASHLALAYAAFRGVRTTTFRIFNVYGPRCEGTQLFGSKAIPAFVTAIHAGEPLPIFGSGRQVMDLVWAEDVASVMVGMLGLTPGGGEVIDIGSGKARTVLDVAALILGAAGRSPMSGDFIFHPQRMGEGHEHPVADTEAIHRALGFESPDADDDVVVARLRVVLDSYRSFETHLSLDQAGPLD